jgi:mRNA interferase RelE/StbE
LSYQVLLHPKAAKELKDMHEPYRTQVNESLKELMFEPENKGKILVGSKYLSLRVGDYRAIYEINHDEKQVIVLYIGYRKNVYDDFTKIF